jgi:hypothetical protein
MVPVKKGKNYFTQDTELAILEYNNCEDFSQRSRIYDKKIHYAFFKLTENIIHTFKFYYTEVNNLEDLQHEVITFLLSKIHLYNQDKGKAYSYFGTIAKRYLIISNTKNYKRKIDTISLTDIGNSSNEGDDYTDYSKKSTHDEPQGEITIFDEEKNILPEKDVLAKFMDLYVDYCSKNIYKFFPKEIDAQIADAILELFRKRDHLTIFNKKALYIYIREIIDAKTPKITKIAFQLYGLFKTKYAFYLENGYFES